MPKLKLKRTPEEEAQHKLRKQRKKEAKKRKLNHEAKSRLPNGSPKGKRPHVNDDSHHPRKWASSDEDEEEQYSPQPSGSRLSEHNAGHKPDLDAIRAEIENQLFREKMFEALGDDERLDSLEAQMNDFAHIPDRWRTDGGKRKYGNLYDYDDVLKLDPRTMDDEEYAEWVRAGMYRKTHADEFAEQQRKKAARAARQAEAKARKVETAKLEQAAKEERIRKKLQREHEQFEHAKRQYHARWKEMLAIPVDTEAVTETATQLRFEDIPWPIAKMYKHFSQKQGSRNADQPVITMDDLVEESVSAFLLRLSDVPDGEKAKEKKEILRETFLRFHPDKFEGRFMKRVRESDRELVREAIGQISRILNALTART